MGRDAVFFGGEWALLAHYIVSVYTNTPLWPWRKLWAVPNCRECGMKGNMPGLIRAVPRREMEDRSQGSTKGNWHSPGVSVLLEWKPPHILNSPGQSWTRSAGAAQRELIYLCFCWSSHSLQINYWSAETFTGDWTAPHTAPKNTSCLRKTSVAEELRSHFHDPTSFLISSHG